MNDEPESYIYFPPAGESIQPVRVWSVIPRWQNNLYLWVSDSPENAARSLGIHRPISRLIPFTDSLWTQCEGFVAFRDAAHKVVRIAYKQLEKMMQTITLQTQTTFIMEECYSCGVPFGISETTYRQAKDKGTTFYCPNGHGQVYIESREQKLKELEKRLKAEEQRANWWKEEAQTKAKQLSTTRSQLTKTKNRISKGICPCCHRQFVNLQRHMQNQHPGYEKESESE